MSNVFTNTNMAVLSIMDVSIDGGNTYSGSTVFVQRKPESDYGNLSIISFAPNAEGLTKDDFNVQARFEANVVPKIETRFSSISSNNITLSNSDISINSYKMDGTAIT